MAIVRYEPLPYSRSWVARRALTPSIDRLFDRIFEDGAAFHPARALRPGVAANLYDTGDGFVVELPLPGVRPEDLELTIRENVLAIKAKRTWQSPEQAQIVWRGFAQGEWQQSFTLPSEVDADKVEAHLEHGVLRLELPKSDRVRPRTIKVNGAPVAHAAAESEPVTPAEPAGEPATDSN